MKIKKIENLSFRRFNISEWNDEIECFFRPLNGLDALAVTDAFYAFNDKKRTAQERFNAAFEVAKLALVDADGRPLLTDDDREALQNASFQPITRMWQFVIDPEKLDDSIKKK